MLAPQALFRLIISRALPQANPDSPNQDAAPRGGRDGSIYSLPLVRKTHLLADEGSYYVTNNGQTAITGDTSVAFTATKPTLWIYNTESAGNLGAKRVYVDRLELLAGATPYSNATSNTGFYFAAVTDNGDRGVSGGTDLTPNLVCPNAGSSRSSISKVRFGGLTAAAATLAARTIVGQRLLRLPVSATAISLANVDEFFINFGGVESDFASPQATLSATLEATKVTRAITVPPIILDPNQCCLIYLFMVANSAGVAGTLLPEIGLFER